MLEILKYLFENIDLLSIIDAIRKRNNRVTAARLHAILVLSFEIVEIYRVLLDELKAALGSQNVANGKHSFYLNPARVAALLQRQGSNLEVMETLIADLFDELVILDKKFVEAQKQIFPGKSSILSSAYGLLIGGRLPLVETRSRRFPQGTDSVYRTLWFTWEKPTEDRKELEKYLYGWDGREKSVVDVNLHDGDLFFRELEAYFVRENPYERLAILEAVNEGFRKVLLDNFDVSDLLTDIANIRRFYSWVEK